MHGYTAKHRRSQRPGKSIMRLFPLTVKGIMTDAGVIFKSSRNQHFRRFSCKTVDYTFQQTALPLNTVMTTRHNAPVICIPGSLGTGYSGDIAGPKCRDLTFDESRQCRRCAGVLISRQNANLCHILTTRGKLSMYNCTV